MAKENWHLDKKISISVIISITLVFITGILCYAKLANNDSNQAADIARIMQILDNRAQFGANYTDRLSKVEMRVDFNEAATKELVIAMNKGFDKLGEKIDKLYEVKK